MVKRGHKLEAEMKKKEQQLTWLIMVWEHVKTRSNMVINKRKKFEEKM